MPVPDMVGALPRAGGRRSVELPSRAVPDWSALHNEAAFLYHRMADRDRALLFIGELSTATEPAFTVHGDDPFAAVTDWVYGHCCYDLKNEMERLSTRHPDPFNMPLRRWSVPRWVVEWKGDRTRLHAHPQDLDAGEHFCEKLFALAGPSMTDVPLLWQEPSRERYLAKVRSLMDHIRRGDIYEVNYCVTREAMAPGYDPFVGFDRVLRYSDATFAAFIRMGHKFALCASPERFLAFDKARVMGQPMKGTRPRSGDPAEDARLSAELAADPKERSENIMALDVMRNDLSRVAAPNSVVVEELCVVRPHGQVHQMTSTLAATLRQGATPWDAVRAAFPPASMTGAPKIRAMELIDAFEDQRRGSYSGTMGWFSPDGTGDLNVVIRTLLHDAATGYTSLTTGSAITAACDPEKEWEECELKARSVIEALAP